MPSLEVLKLRTSLQDRTYKWRTAARLSVFIPCKFLWGRFLTTVHHPPAWPAPPSPHSSLWAPECRPSHSQPSLCICQHAVHSRHNLKRKTSSSAPAARILAGISISAKTWHKLTLTSFLPASSSASEWRGSSALEYPSCSSDASRDSEVLFQPGREIKGTCLIHSSHGPSVWPTLRWEEWQEGPENSVATQRSRSSFQERQQEKNTGRDFMHAAWYMNQRKSYRQISPVSVCFSTIFTRSKSEEEIWDQRIKRDSVGEPLRLMHGVPLHFMCKTLEVLNHLALLWLRGGGPASGGQVPTETCPVTWPWATTPNRALHHGTSRQRSSLLDGPTTQTQRAVTTAQQLPLKPNGVGSLCRLVLRSGLVGDPVIRPKSSSSIKEAWSKIWHSSRTHYKLHTVHKSKQTRIIHSKNIWY